jgi:hypothetical protein
LFIFAHPNTLRLADLVELLLEFTLRALLAEDVDVDIDARLVASSSFAFLALRPPTVSACWGGTSKVGNMPVMSILATWIDQQH